jgi:hypothetical protein
MGVIKWNGLTAFKGTLNPAKTCLSPEIFAGPKTYVLLYYLPPLRYSSQGNFES